MTTPALAADRSVAPSPLRLLIVASDTYPPARVDVSVLFGRELASRGHRIDWILQSETPCRRAYRTAWGGGQVWVGPTDLGTSLIHRVRKHALGILHDLRLFSVLRRRDHDIVEVKDKFLSGMFAVVAARLFGMRFVYWLSYPFPEHYLEQATQPGARYGLLYKLRGTVFKILLYRLLLPAADHVFAQSEQMRRDLAAEGVPLAKTTAVPMGIEIDAALVPDAAVQRTLITPSEKCFLYLGTLGRFRRLDFLVRVLAKVHAKVPSVRLYMVGGGDDPSDEQLLTDEAQRLGVLPALVLVGQLPRAEALRYVREADVCVSPIYPSRVLNAGSPTKLVEYMAMGKAVVANDNPEQRLVIDESGAGYCVEWDEQAFADAIVRLLNEPGTAAAMGQRGRLFVEKHRSYPRLADLVEEELQKLVAQPKHAR